MLVPNNMGLFLHAFMMNKDGYPKLLFVAILFSMFTAASAFTFLLLFGKYGSLVFKSFAINYFCFSFFFFLSVEVKKRND